MTGAAIALLLGFVLLAAGRARTAAVAYAAQSAAVAAVAGWQAMAQRSAMLGGVAALVLALGAVVVPAMLHRAGSSAIARRDGRAAWLAALLVLAALVIAAQPGVAMALALLVALAGLLALAAAAGERAGQTAGLGATANGAILATLLLPAGPMPALLAAAALALPVVAARA